MNLLDTPQAGKYGLIYADPPWHFATRSPKGDARSASIHYPTMTLEDIKALPVAEVAAKDCVLLMWVVDPMLPEALEVLKAWGFTFKTVGFYWAKTTKSGSDHVGMGYWTRANPEQCWLATRGSPKRVDASVRRLLVDKVREHSRKPDTIRARAERLLGDVPRLEMFCRTTPAGWDAWGNEVGKFTP